MSDGSGISKCVACGYIPGPNEMITGITGGAASEPRWRCPNPSCNWWNAYDGPARDSRVFPRRRRIDLASPVEQKIRAAMAEVESLGADVRLTNAAIKLEEAKDLVADYIEAHIKNPEPPPPVDRSQQQLTDGSPVPEDRSHTELLPDGQQKGYVVLSPEERAKGFARPVRRSYKHLKCGTVTTMGQALAETYARDPKFYSGTFCCHCAAHYPLSEFVWSGTTETVGS